MAKKSKHKPTATFNPTGKQILARMEETDYTHVLTTSPKDVPTHTVVEWMVSNEDPILEERAQDFLTEREFQLRSNAIGELKQEWEQKYTPAVVAQRKVESLKVTLARIQGELAEAEAELTQSATAGK